jgi:hypothetical protein
LDKQKSQPKSVIRTPVAPIKVEDLIKPIGEQRIQPQNPQKYSNLPCAEIRKAKPCKSNPKCDYDYINYKCFDKVDKKSPSKKSHKSHKSKRMSNNNVKRHTKKVFSKLIESFSRIGNEAKKDTKILANAANKL